MLDYEKLKLFDQLRCKLEQEIGGIESANLDLLIPSYARATELHKQCLELLDEVTQQLPNTAATQREWNGFKATKAKIEHLDTQLSSEKSLYGLVSAYLELRDLVTQYQQQLESTQNLIETGGNSKL